MRQGQAVFVDSGAWIALALSQDSFHEQAREHWDLLRGTGAKLHTSVPVIVEAFHISRLQHRPTGGADIEGGRIQIRNHQDPALRAA